jgi:hypothetical protein
MKYPFKRPRRFKPRIKGHREFTDREPEEQEIRILPKPEREEVRTILVGGKEYQTLVKTYSCIQQEEEPNNIQPSRRLFGDGAVPKIPTLS